MYSHIRELKSPRKSNLPSLEDPETNYKISPDMEPKDEKNSDSQGDKGSANGGNSVSGLPALGQLNAADDDDHGFKTPTSSEHRIPVCTECPPAPKKKKRARPTEEESTLVFTKRGRMISDEEVSFWFFGMESKAAV